jgi:hypothetical protein
MERLKIDKSRTVRDACSIYLGQALQCWSHEEGYLTDEIWLQVGKTLIATLRDPSPSVRSNSKLALERIRRQQQEQEEQNGGSSSICGTGVWDRLVNDPDGPAARDRKLQQWLKTLGTSGKSPDADDLSVASRFSYNSDIRIRTKSSFSPSSNLNTNINNNNNNNGKMLRPTRVEEGDHAVPSSIAVTGANGGMLGSAISSTNGGGGGGAAAAAAATTTSSLYKKPGSGLGPPLRRLTAPPPVTAAAVAAAAAAHSSPPRISDTNNKSAATTPPPVLPAVSGESLSDLEQILTLQLSPSPSGAAAARKAAPSPPPAQQQVAAGRPSDKSFRYDNDNSDVFDEDHLKIKKHPISDLKNEPSTKKDYTVQSTTTTTTGQKEENPTENDNLLQLEEASSFPADLNLPALRETFARTTSTKSPKVEDMSSNNNNNHKLSMATAVSEESILSIPSGESKDDMPSVSSTQAVITVDNKGTTSSIIANIVPSLTNSSTEDGPFVANMQELKKYSKRRTRSSLLIQERLRISASLSMPLEEDEPYKTAAPATETTIATGERSDEENATPNSASEVILGSGGKPPVFPTPKQPLSSSLPSQLEIALSPTDQSDGGDGGAMVSQAPEHMVIAIRLLKAHKEHVDAIMETLRIEMETLRDFDQLLEEPGRPTEEEVLDYFESVGICLEQRTLAGSQLQRELDLVSRGEPPQD